jgi:hypothetical protein
MLTFREFYDICEGKKPATPPQAVPGTYKRDSDGTVSYTLQRYDGPVGKPTKKEVDKLVVKRSGGKEVKKELKRRAKQIKKIGEDVNQLQKDLSDLERQSAPKDRLEARREAAKRRAQETRERMKERQKEYTERQQELRREREEEMKQRIALRKEQ